MFDGVHVDVLQSFYSFFVLNVDVFLWIDVVES